MQIVRRRISFLLLIVTLFSLIPHGSVVAAPRGFTASQSSATVPAILDAPPPGFVPTGAAPETAATSLVNLIKQFLEGAHAVVSGSLDSTFTGATRQKLLDLGSFTMVGNNQNHIEILDTLDGVPTSLEADIQVQNVGGTGDVPAYNDEATLRTRPYGVYTDPNAGWTGAWQGDIVMTRLQSENGAVRIRVSLPRNLDYPRDTPIELQLGCYVPNFGGNKCTWTNVAVYEDVPTWNVAMGSRALAVNVGGADTTFSSPNRTTDGTLSGDSGGGTFLGFDMAEGNAGDVPVVSPLIQMPTFADNDIIALSIRWSRVMDSYSGSPTLNAPSIRFVEYGSAIEHGVELMRLGPDDATVGYTGNQPWTTETSGDLDTPTSRLSGRQGYLVLRGGPASYSGDPITGNLVGMDSLQLLQNGVPIDIPLAGLAGDQNVNCVCHPHAAGSADSNVAVADPVDMLSGALFENYTDMQVATAGQPLDMTRAYVSLIADPARFVQTPLGPGWRANYHETLAFPTSLGGEATRVIYESASGNRYRFYGALTGPFAPAPGVLASLAWNAGTSRYVLTLPSQEVREFDNAGRLVAIRDAAGHTQTIVLGTTGIQTGLPTSVTDATTGRSLAFTYVSTTAGVRLDRVTNQLGHSVLYAYNSGRLHSVTALDSSVKIYGYGTTTATQNLIERIFDSQAAFTANQPATLNTYTNGKVTQQIDPTGAVWAFTYGQDPSTLGPLTTVTISRNGTVLDTWKYYYRPDTTLQWVEHNNTFVSYRTFGPTLTPSAQVDASGRVARITRNAAGLPTAVKSQRVTAGGLVTPPGNPETATYTSRNQPATVTGADGVARTWTYNATNPSLPETQTVGTLQTTFTYIPGTTRLQKITRPDGVITWYTYDTASPFNLRTVVQGYGQPGAVTTSYTYDVLGQITDVTIGTGTSAVTTHTDYRADGQIWKVTRNYKAGQPVTPSQNLTVEYGYDAAGRPLWTKGPDGVYRNFTYYNAAGQMLWTVENPVNASGVPTLPTGATPPAFVPSRPDANVATIYTYDELGRVSLVEETGILDGVFQPATLTFAGSTTRVIKTEYDAIGRPEKTILNYRANVNGGVFTPTQPDVNVPLLTYYDAAGRVIWTRDGLARWHKTVYDDQGRVFMTYQNYEDGNPNTVAPANTGWTTGTDSDIITAHGYNTLGQLQYRIDNYVDGAPAASQNPDGSWTITELTTDRVTLFSYDSLGRQTDVTPNFLAQPTVTNGKYTMTTRFDPTTGRVQATSDLLGQWHAPVYDELGRTTHTIQNCRTGTTPASGGSAACGAATTDRNVRTTKSRYDVLGRVSETTDVLGIVTRTTFDGLDRPIEVIANYQAGVVPTASINVKTTTTYYTVSGNLWWVTDPTGRATTYLANALGQVVSTTDAANLETRVGYDRTGQRWSKSPAGVITVNRVDGLGRVIATIENYQNGTVEAGDLTTHDLITTTTYDVAGRVVETVTPAGEVTRSGYDLRDQLITVIEGVKTTCPTYTPANADCNLTTEYTYDRAGNATAIKNPRGYSRTMGYGTRNELLWTTNETATITDNRQYDRAGRLTRTDVNGTQVVNTYVYDELGRQKNRNGQSWTYNAIGRALSFYDPAAVASGKTGILGYTYDDLGRVIQTQASLDGDPTAGLFTYNYDAAGRVTKADATTYEYDSAGRPTWVKWGAGLLTEQTYDSVGRPSTLKRYSGTTVESISTTTYDAAQRVAGIKTDKLSTAATLANFTYTYDRASRVKTFNEQVRNPAGGTDTVNHSYAYDLVGRVIEEGTITTTGAVANLSTEKYRYDGAGNRTGIWNAKGTQIQSRTYNAANQVTNSGWTYDAAGRLITDGVSTYRYDDFDRMNRVIKDGVTTTMSYHGEQMLAKYANNARTFGYIHNTVTGPHSTLQRLYDFQTPGYPVINNYYFYDLNGTPLYSYENNGTVVTQRMLLTDQMKTIRATHVLNSTSPQRLGSDAWGVATTAQQGYLRFNGEFSDEQFDLVFMRARWYSPANGTFLSRDPFAGFPTTPYSMHPYQFGYSNPVSNADPSGRCIPEDVPWIGQEGCTWAGANPADWNWQDGSDYARGVGGALYEFADGVRQTVAPTPMERYQQAQQYTYMITHPDEIPGMIIDGFTSPFKEFYQGWLCQDFYMMGHGAVGSGAVIVEVAGGIQSLSSLGRAMAKPRAARAPKVRPTTVDPEPAPRRTSPDVDAPCPGNSFVAGTLVKSEHGLVAIETLREGDRVWAVDPETGEAGYYPITWTTHHATDEIVTISVMLASAVDDETAEAPQRELIAATVAHPFWVEGRGWTDAGDVHEGDTLLAADGRRLIVADVERATRTIEVYNFTVDTLHTYTVTRWGVVVHNVKNCVPSTAKLWEVKRENSDRLARHRTFGTILRTKKPNSLGHKHWWSRDNAGHANSAWKVFKETTDGLEWIADADQYGNYMPDKYKGPTGRFIPWKDLVLSNP